jgi:sortase A
VTTTDSPPALVLPEAGTPTAGRSRGAWRERWHAGRLAVGVLLVAAGLGVLGFVLWEYVGTTIVAQHHQRETIDSLDRAWGDGHDSAPTDFGTAVAIIEIPRFGSSYRVPVFEGTNAKVLAAGYGHLLGSALPGQVGNYVIAAHRVTHGEPLRNMPDLRIGDVVRVLTRTNTYVYRLTTNGDDLIVPFTTRWVTTPLPHNPAGGVQPPQKPGGRLITLSTCASLFFTKNREIAFGVLDRTIPTGRVSGTAR